MKTSNNCNIFRAMALSGTFFSLVLATTAAHAQSPLIVIPTTIIQNGDFETGDLSGWSTFVTANGDIGGGWGLPDVVPFDVAGSGTPSYAAQFQVGQVTYIDGDSEGGGISQTIFGSPNSLTFSADIAAYNPESTLNAEAGIFSIIIDGMTVSSVDLGSINAGQTLRGTLTGTLFLPFGANDLSIEITRPFTNGSITEAPNDPNVATPFEYVDNIQVSPAPVPEPSTFALGLLGLFPLWAARKARNC